MSLSYALDERRPPVPTYSAGDGCIIHWTGSHIERSGADVTLADHLLRADATHLPPEKRARARLLADQLTAAMHAAFPLKEF